jgi:dTDP-4-amino-4,6-dideoxygalactose transaminase
MDNKLCGLKVALERIWSAAAPDYQKAVRLVAEIASVSEHATLRQAAAQALPILRSAGAENADRATRDAARRRLGVVREVLESVAGTQFGKRQLAAELPRTEQRYRQMLGLPLGRRLSGQEIHRAWKRLAKTAHPDAGGTVGAFQELSAARDALMQEMASSMSDVVVN